MGIYNCYQNRRPQNAKLEMLLIAEISSGEKGSVTLLLKTKQIFNTFAQLNMI